MTTKDVGDPAARLRRVAMLAAQAGKTPAQIKRAVVDQVKRDAAARRRAMLAGGQEELEASTEEPAESAATTDQTPTDPAKARRRLMLGLKETD